MNSIPFHSFLILLAALCWSQAVNAAESPIDQEILDRIKVYDYGQSRADLNEVADLVTNALEDRNTIEAIERQLLDLLKAEDSTFYCKQFVCRQLWIMGSPQSVPILSRILTSDEFSDMARYALERNPHSDAGAALRDALQEDAPVKVHVGIINSIGQRVDDTAIQVLAQLAKGDDPELQAAAIAALGRIGGGHKRLAGADSAANAAEVLEPLASEGTVGAIDALLLCGDGLVTNGESASARRIYHWVWENLQNPKPTRIAALRGLLTVDHEATIPVVISLFHGDDLTMSAVAAGFVRQLSGQTLTKTFASELPKMPASSQTLLIAALADRGDPAALPALIEAVGHDDEQVKLTAVRGLGTLRGSEKSILTLANTAATHKGALRNTARDSLARVSGLRTDRIMINHISKGSTDRRTELIRALGQRHASAAAQPLARILGDPDSSVRIATLGALAEIAAEGQYDQMVERIVKSPDKKERQAASKAVVTVGRRIHDEVRRASPLANALSATDQIELKVVMVKTLGELGGQPALSMLRSAHTGKEPQLKDAAIRALAEWEGVEVIADLGHIAKSSDEQTHRILALRGYIRLIGQPSDRSTEETIGLFANALGVAGRPDEKKLALGGLGNVQDPAALEIALAQLDNKDLSAEAAQAAVKIAGGILAKHPDAAKAALEKVKSASTNEDTLKKADELLEKIAK